MPARHPTIWGRLLRRNLPLQAVLMGSVALQVLAVTGLTGYFSFRNGQAAIHDLTVQLRNQASVGILNRLKPYLAAPHQLNQLKANAVRFNHVRLDRFDPLPAYLLSQLQVFDTVTNTGFATTTGNYISVGRQIDGSFSNPVIDRSQEKFFRYGLDQQGKRTDVLQVSPYRDPRMDDWYRQALKADQAIWSPIFTWTFKQFGIGLMAAQPVYDEAGKLVGVANSGLVLDHISGFLQDLKIAKLGKVFILERSGLLVASSTGESPIRKSAHQTTTERIAAFESNDSLLRLTTQHVMEQFGSLSQIQKAQQLDFKIAGERQFVQLTPIVDPRGIDWLAVVVVPESAFAEQIYANTETMLWLCLLALLLSTGLGLLTARWLAGPIRRLSQASKALSEGNLDYRVESQHSTQEINALAQSFNQMAQQLQASFAALQTSETSFRNLAANVPGVVFRYIRHPDGSDSVLYVSPACIKIWEVEAQGIEQNPAILWEMMHPDDLPTMQASVAESARSLQSWHQEWRITTPSGRLKWLQGAANPILQTNGDVIWDTVIFDISERQAAEQALKLQRDFNQLIAEITSRFVDLSPADLNTEIERTLHLIGAATQVDTSYLFRFDQAAQTMSMTHEWCQPGCPRHLSLAQHIPLAAFPWSIALAQRREAIQVPCVADLPTEAAIDQAGWQRFNIVAILAVPLIQKSVVTGLMGFASFKDPIVWEDEMIQLLSVMGQTIANAQERTQAEQQLFMSEERLRLALEAANQGLYDLNPQTGEAVVSPEYAIMLGYDPATFHETNANWIERLHPDDRETVAKVYRDYIAGKLPEYKVEFRQRTRTGEWKWILSLGKILAWDAAGQPLRMLGTHTDIDDRKALEQELTENQQLLNAFITSSPVGMCVMDDQLRYTLINAALAEINGIPVAAHMGKTPWDIVPDLASQQAEVFQRVLATGESMTEVEVVGETPKRPGVIRTWLASYFPLRYGSGQPLCIGIVVVETTERSQAMEALRQSEERFRQLADNIQEVFWLSDIEINQILFISPAYEQIWGRSCESLYKNPKSFIDGIHPDDRQRVVSNLAHISEPFEIEYRVVQPTGAIRWVCDRGVPIFDDSGKVIRRTGVSQDITERKLAETLLQQTAERERLVRIVTERIRQSLNLDEILTTTVIEVRQVLQTDRVILLKLASDGTGNVVQESVEPNWQTILGQTLYDPCFQSQYIQQYFHGRVRATADIDDGSIQTCHANFLRQFDIRANLVVPIIQTDHLWGLLIAHQCSQPRQWSEDEIQLLKQLADQVAISLQQSELYQQLQQLNVDLEHQVQQRTHALQQALEFESLLQRIADKVRETLDEQQVIQTAVDELARALHTNGCGIGLFDLEQETSTICYVKLDANVSSLHERVFHFANYPELYRQLLWGEPLQLCGTFDQPYPTPPQQTKGTLLICPLLDNRSALGELWLYRIGEAVFADPEVRLVQQVANQCAIGIRQSRLYQASQIQVEALEQLHQMKDDFLSTVSHELRSPMTNIKMAIQMVELRLHQQQIHDDRLTQYIQILKAGCTQELTLINDLLDLQRLEAGMQSLELESIDLNYWLPSVAEPFKARAQEQYQKLTLDLPFNLPPITTDLASFKRIVMELLHNACKYTPPDEQIIVTAQIRNAILHIQVCNSGVELPPEELPRLFEKFYRVTGSDRWKHGGTGLGLTLVKRLVEHLHGSIGVESATGWTCFTVDLPLKAQFSEKLLHEGINCQSVANETID